MMRVLVCGGRDYGHAGARERIFNMLDLIDNGDQRRIVTIIEGGARGADGCAARWGYNHDRIVETFTAKWDLYGKQAGPIRNREMLEVGKPNLVIAFPGGRGTANMVNQARRCSVQIIDQRDNPDGLDSKIRAQNEG